MKYIDTHAHLNLSAFDGDRTEVISRCHDEDIAVINIGTKESTSQLAVEIAQEHEHMYAMVGLHPIQTTPQYHSEEEVGGAAFTSKGEVFNVDFYRDLAQSSKVVGIGECGFDYWHNGKETYEVQEAAFIAQIHLANELNLPLMIHTRNPKPGETSPTGRSVYADVYDVLNQYAKVPFNVHFYAGTWDEAVKFFDLGGTISFTGVVTFPAHKPGIQDYLDIVKAAPLDRIHAETDAPYVAPVPHRGSRCEPWMAQEVVRVLAQQKNLSTEQMQAQLWENARSLYKI